MKLSDCRGREALISELDYQAASAHRWVANRKSARHIYFVRTSDLLPLHRFLMGLKKGDPGIVDHINGNTLDNRRENLRVVTVSENTRNRHAAYSAQLPGAHVHSPGKWTSRITVNGKSRHLGIYRSPEGASAAYLAAKIEGACS